LSVITMLFLVSMAWAAETVNGYMVGLKKDSLVIRQKGGGTRSIPVNSYTALRFTKKDFVTSDLSAVPKNSKLYVTVEDGIAKLVTVEEVPK